MFDKSDKSSINTLFDLIAKDYDKMNNLMSFGMQKIIKNCAVNNVLKITGRKNLEILDVCCGSGDISLMFLNKTKNSKITAVDFSQNMLEIAKKRVENDGCKINMPRLRLHSLNPAALCYRFRNKFGMTCGQVQNDVELQCLGGEKMLKQVQHDVKQEVQHDVKQQVRRDVKQEVSQDGNISSEIRFLQADAMDLKNNEMLKDKHFDVVFISFGLRNLPDIDEFLAQIRPFVKQGGILSVLDLGKPLTIMNWYFKFHYNFIIPFFAKKFFKDIEPYNYLIESSKTYPAPDVIMEKMEKAGFKNVKNFNFAFGVIAQQVASPL